MPLIAVDPSSRRPNSTLPVLDGEVIVDFLERETGADFMLSALPMQCRTVSQLKAHIAAGALLVQHKSGLDLTNSIMDTRLDESQARMKKIGARGPQCILLYTGAWDSVSVKSTKSPCVMKLNGVTTNTPCNSFHGALARWGERGGWPHNLADDSMIVGFVKMMLRHLEENKAEPVKQVWPDAERMQEVDPNSPLQLLETVTDARVVLVAIKDVGPVLANWLWKVSNGNFALCLAMLTDETYLNATYPTPAPQNYSARLIQKVREFCRLGHYQALGGVDLGEIPF